jgi:hypothetical protein
MCSVSGGKQYSTDPSMAGEVLERMLVLRKGSKVVVML